MLRLPDGRPALTYQRTILVGKVDEAVIHAVASRAAEALIAAESREGLLPKMCLTGMIDAEATAQARKYMSSATAATVAGAAFGYHRNLPLNAALGSNASSSFPWPKVSERKNLIQAPNIDCTYCGQHTEMNSDHVWYYCTGPLPTI